MNWMNENYFGILNFENYPINFIIFIVKNENKQFGESIIRAHEYRCTLHIALVDAVVRYTHLQALIIKLLRRFTMLLREIEFSNDFVCQCVNLPNAINLSIL